MITVERSDVVSVPVTDLDRSTRFSAETLGLMLHRRYAPHES